MTNTSFQVWDADEGGPDDKFDIAGAFDLIHDLERGIRTLERLSPLHTFQACALNHSATSP